MLSRRATYALKALLELAAEPERWRSTHGLASAQQLPEPMLEQLLLRMRRAGLLVARRGRLGGYRLAMHARDLAIAAVLKAVADSGLKMGRNTKWLAATPADQVTKGLQRQLERSQQRTLEHLSLEELLFDLHSADSSAEGEQGLLLG